MIDESLPIYFRLLREQRQERAQKQEQKWMKHIEELVNRKEDVRARRLRLQGMRGRAPIQRIP